ncbi:MAG: hypothetical protein OXL96_24675 [Candidatus Poribacteria bacterium]|nr:hypothetical protein [Candidatus Poribacteria bacterium]
MNRRQFETPVETPEELENRFKTQLGDECGSLYFRLKMEVTAAYDKWVVLRDFMEHATVLSSSAALPFFQLTEMTYWESLLIDITRLTDRSKKGKNDSIFSLSRHLKEPDSIVVHNRAKDAKKKAAPLWEVRNKRIAHSDNAVATGKRALSVTDIDLKEFRDALDSIAETLEVFLFKVLKPDKPVSIIRTRGWHTRSIDSSVNRLSYLMVYGDNDLRRPFEFNEKFFLDEGRPEYIPDYN